jgi:hypothetical protein
VIELLHPWRTAGRPVVALHERRTLDPPLFEALPEQAMWVTRFDGRTPLPSPANGAYRRYDKEDTMSETDPDNLDSDGAAADESVPECVPLDAQLEVEFAASSWLDLDEQWVAWLNDGAELPNCVDGIDPSISYDDDETLLA